MNEAFLHYIWEYRLFDTKNLLTADGGTIEIVKPGKYNTGAGPDFFNAHLIIEGTLWAGNVEIHINSSDWQKHNHQSDPAYDSCILHVVYNNDEETARMNGSIIPVIELKNRFSSYLWDNYLQLIGTRGWIPCQHRIKEIDEQTWKSTKDQMIEERLDQRTQQIFIAINGNKGDWQECFYQQLARNFGFQLNALPFEMLARSLPLKIIRKESRILENIEALIFGQAGMLKEIMNDRYAQNLFETYKHFSVKYSLNSIPYSSWKFLRLRPVNFPAIRLAQFSKLLFQASSLFDFLIESSSVKDLYSLFEVEASDYWNTHYHFNSTSPFKNKRLGKSSINNLLINSCVPFIYAWGKYTGDSTISSKALMFLSKIPSEENHLISHWKEIGINPRNAVDSQSFLQLQIHHCAEKRCLSCNIGKFLIQNLPSGNVSAASG